MSMTSVNLPIIKVIFIKKEFFFNYLLDPSSFEDIKAITIYFA